MIEHWQLSLVQGTDEEEMTHAEEILHRRGEDALVMACRRNQGLAGCRRITVETCEVFSEIRNDPEGHKEREAIPRDDRSEESEWEW